MLDLSFMVIGMLLGFAAAISPGPLFVLVVSETLKYGKTEGVKISLAPLFSNPPVILASLFILSKISSFNLALGLISMAGAAFLAFLAYEGITAKGVEINAKNVKPQSLKKGIITDFLNPHPYVFWFSIGGPILLKALASSFASGMLFIIGFLALLIGSKICIALIVEKSRSFLKSNYYIYLNKILGIALLVLAVFFLQDGLKLVGIV